MDFNLNWIYTAISWILLRWHELLAMVFGSTSDASWVLAIVLLVLTVRAVLFPVFVKGIKSQRKIQELQPRMKEIQEKYKHDRIQMQQEMQNLMRAEKANPLSGCLPLLVQIPVFLGLFHVLRTIKPGSDAALNAMTTEYGWTADQFNSAADATLFGAPIPAAFLSKQGYLDQMGAQRTTVQIVALVLVVTMVATTYLTQRQMIARTGPATSGPQAMIQKFMLYGIPASLAVSGVIFPIGVLIYWVVQNFFSMAQQFYVLKKMPPPNTGAQKKEIDVEAAKASAPKPGARPSREKKPTADTAGDGDATATSGSSAVPRSGNRKRSKKRKGGRI